MTPFVVALAAATFAHSADKLAVAFYWLMKTRSGKFVEEDRLEEAPLVDCSLHHRRRRLRRRRCCRRRC